MATVEIDLSLIIGVVVALVSGLVFLFKLGFSTLTQEMASIKKNAEEEKRLCAENAKIQNQLISDLQKQLVEFSYKLGLLEGRSTTDGMHHAEIDIHHSK